MVNLLQTGLDPYLLVFPRRGGSEMKVTFIEVNGLLLVYPGFGSSPRAEQIRTQDDDSTLYQAHL